MSEKELQNSPERGIGELARLNDLLRRNNVGGRVVITAGVQTLGAVKRAQLLNIIANFNEFDNSNDPYGEHDFGAVVFDGERYFFKVDYYDLDLDGPSINPLDQAVTRRVLTVMRADEY